jgi:hypothetical protein
LFDTQVFLCSIIIVLLDLRCMDVHKEHFTSRTIHCLRKKAQSSYIISNHSMISASRSLASVVLSAVLLQPVWTIVLQS